MSRLITLFLALAFASALATKERPLWRDEYKPHVFQGEVGEPLYLTPLIQAGNLTQARDMAYITEPLEGVEAGQPEGYSGFMTVNATTDSHMFFWFFPAAEVDPSTAPVVVWLQGGPGTSSMFGLFEIHGPISAVYTDETMSDVTGELRHYSWTRRANMIYIDNPVGTGFSHTGDGFVNTQEEVARDLYSTLTQWFTLFPEYQANPFFVFGESYGGKYVPAISRKVHDENQNSPAIPINFQGMGIGNGESSPYDQDIYGTFLYSLGLLGEVERDNCLQREANIQGNITSGQYTVAFYEWSAEVNYFLGHMDCDYYLDFRECENPPEENNYVDYVNKDSVRKAIHVGDIPFGRQSGLVYNNLIDDIMRSQKDNVEFLLERYPVMFYNGNLDIVCHHTGHLEMFNTMQTWSGFDEYQQTGTTQFRVDGEVAGYLKSVQNLRLLAMRNAGHMVPRSQPKYAFDMFEKFINGNL